MLRSSHNWEAGVPGRPLANKLRKLIEDDGGTEFLIDHIGGGGTINQLAVKYDVSRSFIGRLLNNDEIYKVALDEARRLGADAMAEDSLELIDGLTQKADLTSADVQLAKERVSVRKWMAALNHPDKFAPKGAEVTVSIGSLHLGALKKVAQEMRNITPKPAELE
jgi:hypothetical protein